MNKVRPFSRRQTTHLSIGPAGRGWPHGWTRRGPGGLHVKQVWTGSGVTWTPANDTGSYHMNRHHGKNDSLTRRKLHDAGGNSCGKCVNRMLVPEIGSVIQKWMDSGGISRSTRVIIDWFIVTPQWSMISSFVMNLLLDKTCFTMGISGRNRYCSQKKTIHLKDSVYLNFLMKILYQKI